MREATHPTHRGGREAGTGKTGRGKEKEEEEETLSERGGGGGHGRCAAAWIARGG